MTDVPLKEPIEVAATAATANLSNLVTLASSPDSRVFQLPDLDAPLPEYPFQYGNQFFRETFYPTSLRLVTPLVFSLTYFTTVHLVNKIVRERQLDSFEALNPGKPLPKKLPGVPFGISKTKAFNVAVLLHNVFLCIFSVCTFIGMTHTMFIDTTKIIPDEVAEALSVSPPKHMFWQSVCDIDDGIWQDRGSIDKGLGIFGYLFYLSKFYEIIDTIIILLKGRQASLLQSYHHAGAVLCMWSGVRFTSSPIWIFVVFNSFIHSIMYFYFSLSCMHVRLPQSFKQTLTSLQIVQFVVGGLLAIVHFFVEYKNPITEVQQYCIDSPEKAMTVYMNVIYLTPLTMLFAAFYVDSYKKQRVPADKKTN